MAYPNQRRYPLWALPIVAVWSIVTGIVNMVGIILGLVIGALFMMLGLALTATFVGALIGIPLFIVGFMLVLRALY